MLWTGGHLPWGVFPVLPEDLVETEDGQVWSKKKIGKGEILDNYNILREILKASFSF